MSTFLNNFFPADTAAMDPIFYPPSNGIPSESKLATYMNRQNVATPTYGLNTGFSLLPTDSPLSIKKSQVTPHSPEFIPTGINSSPNFYASYHQQPMITNGNNHINNNNSVAPASKTVNGVPASLLGQQKAATVAQQQKLQLQHQQHHQAHHHHQQQQQQQQQQHPTVNGPITHSAPSAPTQTYVGMTTTPLKTRNNLLRNDSPSSGSSIVDKSPLRHTPHTSPIPATLPANVHQENVGGTIYFYPTANHTANPNSNGSVSSVVIDPTIAIAHHPQASAIANITPAQPAHLYTGHVYPGPASNVISMQPKTQLETAFFMPDGMRAEILARNEISNLTLDSTECPPHPGIPLEVENYHALYPLEPVQPLHPKMTLPSSSYKATHNTTGIKYCLRRLHGFRLQSTKCMAVVDMWKKLSHSNVVQLREVFTTKAFGDHSLILVYDYHPGSQTLLTKYFTPTPTESNGYTDPFQGDARPFSHKSNLQRNSNGPLLPEANIWAIIMQLTAGLRAIHQAGLACKVLDPTKIIITGKRVRFSFSGTTDIAQFDPNVANPMAVISMHQQEDLTALGRLVLALSCRCLQSVQNVQTSIEMVSRHYSSDLRNFIVYLFTTSQRRSVTDLMPMIGARFYTQLDALQSQCDMQEDELAKEMENGRLYRILVKLNCINERPDFNLDCTWSETGDRYMLKLFRDYLFHSVSEDGRPWLDHAHIVQCLNKLDAGSLERVQLMSRDEQSVLIVTYCELKQCLENAFAELMANAAS